MRPMRPTETLVSSSTDSPCDVRHLSKRYGEHTVVDDLTFSIPRNHVVGLIGPNGAGKTTTLRMIAGLIRPERQVDTVVVAGYDVCEDASRVRSLLGFQGDAMGVYPRLTLRKQFPYYGELYRLSGVYLKQRVQYVIDLLKM